MPKHHLLALAALLLAACNAQQATTAQQNSPEPTPLSEADTAKQVAEEFLVALQGNDLAKVRAQTCLQTNDLTRYAPIGVQSWEFKTVIEEPDNMSASARSFSATTDIQAQGKTEAWKVRVWKSEEFFVSWREFTKEMNEQQAEINTYLESTGREPEELDEIPGRQDISLEEWCVEGIGKASDPFS